jgi:hypothetical protein
MSSSPTAIPVPTATLLGACAAQGCFTDAYALVVPGPVTLADFIEAFYTSRLFKLERWLLARLLDKPSTDLQARQLAHGQTDTFSAWRVEQRTHSEILLQVGPTRSWLSVTTEPGTQATCCSRLLFGSAIAPTRPGGRKGWGFVALGGFHRLYSRWLLRAAAQRLRSA